MKQCCWNDWLDGMMKLDANTYCDLVGRTNYCPVCGVHAPWGNDCKVVEE